MFASIKKNVIKKLEKMDPEFVQEAITKAEKMGIITPGQITVEMLKENADKVSKRDIKKQMKKAKKS